MRSHGLTIFVLSAASLALFASARAVGDVERSTPDQGAVRIARDAQPRWRVGQLFIVGNEEIPDSIIQEQCAFFPGTPVTIADLREAEKNLARLGFFVIDRKRGIRPTVKFLDREDNDEDRFFDIQIEVKEKANAKQLLAIRECIHFVVDWKTWGVCVAVYRAEGFPREILALLTEGKMAEIPGLIRGKFQGEEEGCTGYSPPAAVSP
ncbi:MAG: POTRA domain-containing protein [Gemmataceae bacterium]